MMLPVEFDMMGKIAFITGDGLGIGKGIAQVLAEAGADVVKMKPHGGSPTRRIGLFYVDKPDPERLLYFWQGNRGKRSIALDLDHEADSARFRALLATADILLESTPKGQRERRRTG
jgi:benzylsuccinate CoA-transferase BbsE subunit